LGIEIYEFEGVQVRCYSKEKTVVDCFRFRNKIGVDIAIEALKKILATGSSPVGPTHGVRQTGEG
jgi:hypothetical protein